MQKLSNLDKSTSNNYVVVDEQFSWTERFNISNITHYLTLSAGKYNAKYDNGKAGTYYEGSSNCLRWRVVNDDKSIKGSDNNLRCGVYVPNNTDERVLIYYYIDPEASRKTIAEAGQSGTLIHALSETEEDNLHHLMYQPDASALKAAIKVVK